MKKRTGSILCAILLLCVAFCFLVIGIQPEEARAAATGYTDHAHNFTSASKCGSKGCNGTGYSSIKAYAGLNGSTKCSKCNGATTLACTNNRCSSGKIKCTTCGGNGYTDYGNSTKDVYITVSGTTYTAKETWTFTLCEDCCPVANDAGYEVYIYLSEETKTGTFDEMKSYFICYEDSDGKYQQVWPIGEPTNCTTCGGDAKITCTQCSGSGYYGVCGRCNGKGKNYKCQNAQCTQGYYGVYDDWKTEPDYNAVCYTTENSYTIGFAGNGHTGGSTANLTGCLYDNSYTLTANGYTKTGYTFKNWNTKTDGTGTSYANKASVSKLSATDGATVYLYAQWTENKYNISFNANGGTGSMASMTNCLYDNSYTLTNNAFVRTGYTFKNWNTKADGSGTSYSNLASVSKLSATNGATVTLYAQWEKNEYNVTFNPTGGTVTTASMSIFYGDAYGELPIPVRAGYTHLGWYTKQEGGVKIESSDLYQLTENQILYAHWDRDGYTVTYHGNGGTVSVDSVENYYGEAIDLSVTAVKDGYLFIGWNTDPNATTGLTAMQMPEEDVDLYAIYSIPVSDIKDVYLKIWTMGNEANYRIYYLGKTSAQNMNYTYELDDNDVIDFLGGSAYDYAIIVLDHAGNSNSLAGDDEEQKYLQTVEHYMLSDGKEIKFNTITEERYKGETYNPAYVTPPTGYKPISISPGYVVEGDTVSKAYYEPIEYVIKFDANGGTCQVTSKSIYYGASYGELPTPEREGHTFLGWYTDKEAGTLVRSENKYLILGDSTLYARWEENSYKVIYDYATNGGTLAGKTTDSVLYGADIDLSVSAVKEGWKHIGWNTDPNATVGLESLQMGNQDVVLYAIFEKDITVKFVSWNEDGQHTKTYTVTLYNTQTEVILSVPGQEELSGWTALGWTLSQTTDGTIHTSEGSSYVCKDNLTFYGRYSMEVTLSYDTNGASAVIASQSKVRYFNAYGVYKNPMVQIAAAPTLLNSSFVAWMDMESGKTYAPETTMEMIEDVHLTAKWDMYPELSAYNRYFTLDEAKNGLITEAALLSKVVGTDAEDGILVNGVAVTVVGYDASIFTSMTTDTEVEITYRAVDSFGNSVTKTVAVKVVDTTVRVSNRVTYYRFISNRFYKEGDVYVPANKGGLEETSIWKTNPTYQSLMDAVMSNKKINQVTRKISFYGNEKEYVIPGSGTWEHVEETWYFTKEDIAKTNDFREQYGYGSSKVTNYLEMFLEWFGHCKK